MLRPVSVHTRVSSHVDCSAEWHNLDACPLHAKSSDSRAPTTPAAPPPATDRSNFRLPYSTPAVELYPSFGSATHSRERRARTAHLSGAGTATRTRLSFPTTYSHSPAPPHMVKVADQPPLTRGSLAVCHLAAASPGHAHPAQLELVPARPRPLEHADLQLLVLLDESPIVRLEG